jgi:Multiubiquitin
MKTQPSDQDSEIIDIESFARKGERPPSGNRYRIRVDKTVLVVDGPTITGRGILEVANRTPAERYRLDQKLRGGETRKIELETVVDLTTPGLERFMSIPLDQTEGAGYDGLAE